MATHFLRSPWLGAEFWQGDYKNPLMDAGAEVVRVVLRSNPFEIRLPAVPTQGWVKVCSSYDAGIFSQIAHNTDRSHVPYFRSGTGMADTTFGSGSLWITPEAHMHLDWGGRLLPRSDGGGVVLFNAIFKLGEEEPAMPSGRDIYLVIYVGDSDNHVLDRSNFECFILSF
jgi:hypothetical protein